MEKGMSKGRLEAFSDGVLAIIITIMVLELKPPHGPDLYELWMLAPVFFSYVLSFVYVGIYWNNHHHLLHASEHVSGGILWANLHVLFWLSLVPFSTAWMGEQHFAALPVALYGLVLLFSAIGYFFLTKRLIAHHGPNSLLAESIGRDRKGRISLVGYAIAIPLAFFEPRVSFAGYILVAIMWLLPDPRIEKTMSRGTQRVQEG